MLNEDIVDHSKHPEITLDQILEHYKNEILRLQSENQLLKRYKQKFETMQTLKYKLLEMSDVIYTIQSIVELIEINKE